MIKKNWIYILFAFSVIAYFTSAYISWKNSYEIESKAIKSGSGWGYEIYVGKKIFITQRNIPAIIGTKQFVSEEQAKKVAELVIVKLKQKHALPSVTVHELDSLGIEK